MGLIVKHYDGSDFLNVENKTYDDFSTSLVLPGKGVLNWGEKYISNFVHLMENFASALPPRSPQHGQIWYNNTTSVLSVYTQDNVWEQINKDGSIEQKFDEIIARLSKNNASAFPPTVVVAGTPWFDTSSSTLKVHNGTEWISFGFSNKASYTEPTNAVASDLWYDKNKDNLFVHDGEQYQRIVSTIESIIEPQNSTVGQWWSNPSTGNLYVNVFDTVNQEYYWKDVGLGVTTGDIFPPNPAIGAMHIVHKTPDNILYINKGTKSHPIWSEIPEFGGAIKSSIEPTRILDGMFWLDDKDVLRVRKTGRWVDIDESAISLVSNMQPSSSAKEGTVWFDTASGILKVRVNSSWVNIQSTGLISYGNAPSNPKIGQLWYDVTSSELNLWSGAGWVKVNGGAIIVSYVTPTANEGQLWLDTTTSELKVKKNGRWSSLPENARAHLTYPANPKSGDLAYVNGTLKIFDTPNWKDININIDNSTSGNASVNYDPLSHEIVMTNDGVVTRVPLAVKREIIIENVGITSDIIEVLKPNIKPGERRIINIQKINLNKQFFVFRNGLFTDNWRVDTSDLILNHACSDDDIDVLQFSGDASIDFVVKKFKATTSGTFTIDNYTRTEVEQEAYDLAKTAYDVKKKQLIAQYVTDSQVATESMLTPADKAILKAIEGTFPVKTSNKIADLTLGGIMVFKEGAFVPLTDMKLNTDNDNSINIPNTTAGEVFSVIQFVVGKDYKAAFSTRDHSFTIGEIIAIDNIVVNQDSSSSVAGVAQSSNVKDRSQFGKQKVTYTFDKNSKTTVFNMLDIDIGYQFFVTRNNLFVSPTQYTVDATNKTTSLYANEGDTIRFFQFYLPHNYTPVEFNYTQKMVKMNGWLTFDLNKDYNVDLPMLVFRNGVLLQKSAYTIIKQETITETDGFQYQVNGLKRIRVIGDTVSNTESTAGVLVGDVVTIMQVTQPDIYNIFVDEFYATVNGTNIFGLNTVIGTKDFMVFKNGVKLEHNVESFYINAAGRLVVLNCFGPTLADLSINPNARGDDIVVYQFFTKDNADSTDVLLTEEVVTATKNGAEYFNLQQTRFVSDEFLLVFKNGQMVIRKNVDDGGSEQNKTNTFQTFIERIYHSTVPAIDENGNQLYDTNSLPIMNTDPNDYTDFTAFSLDNVVSGEKINVFEFNKKIALLNNLAGNHHFEIIPPNNIQRLYTTKFNQLSNMTLVFQDGYLIDRTTDNNGNDTYRSNGMLRLLDQYAVDHSNKSILVNDWKVGGKLRVHQFTASQVDIKTITLTVRILSSGTFDIFLPNNEIYTPNTGALEIYVDKVVQWSGDDYIESANNKITFIRSLNKDQIVKINVRK